MNPISNDVLTRIINAYCQSLHIHQKIPQPGEHVQFGGQDWVVLGIEQGGLLVISAKLLPEDRPFDNNGSNDWRKASIREYLNGEYLETLGTDGLTKFTSDLTSDDGMDDYGTSEDYVFLLSDNLYRKYRKYIPNYGRWWWTLTPWSCRPSYANFVRVVSASGAFSHYFAYFSLGLAPSLLLDLSSLEV